MARGVIPGAPDLLVLAVDANAQGHAATIRHCQDLIDRSVYSRSVVACPDPHGEAWLWSDPAAFHDAIGVAAPTASRTDEGAFKQLLATAIRDAGHPLLTDPMSFAPEIVERMDLHAAGRRDPALRRFLREARAELRDAAAAS